MNQTEIDYIYIRLKENGQVDFITFHPSYSYEEFIEGITVDLKNNGKYILKNGIFKKLSIKALKSAIEEDITDDLKNQSIDDQSAWINLYNVYKKIPQEVQKERWLKAKKFAIVIDEINRGDPSKIFGELITLLEADKRLGADNELEVKLPYSNDLYSVPQNIYLIGTMNTADRSIALVDIALRRRFGFVEMMPNFEDGGELVRQLKDKGIYTGDVQKSIEAIRIINNNICNNPLLGKDKTIGHSFFFRLIGSDNVEKTLDLIWKSEILPLLEEYCYGRYEEMNKVLFGNPTTAYDYIDSRGIRYDKIRAIELAIEIINTSRS